VEGDNLIRAGLSTTVEVLKSILGDINGQAKGSVPKVDVILEFLQGGVIPVNSSPDELAILAAVLEVLDPLQAVRVRAGGRGNELVAKSLLGLQVLVVKIARVLRSHVSLTRLVRFVDEKNEVVLVGRGLSGKSGHLASILITPHHGQALDAKRVIRAEGAPSVHGVNARGNKVLENVHIPAVGPGKTEFATLSADTASTTADGRRGRSSSGLWRSGLGGLGSLGRLRRSSGMGRRSRGGGRRRRSSLSRSSGRGSRRLRRRPGLAALGSIALPLGCDLLGMSDMAGMLDMVGGESVDGGRAERRRKEGERGERDEVEKLASGHC